MDSRQIATCMIDIEGMTCQSCVKNIENVVAGKVGIISVKVDLESKEGCVTYDAHLVDPLQIISHVNSMEKFMAKIKTESIQVQTCVVQIEGMKCQSCVRNIEGTISSKTGVMNVKVDLDRKEGSILYDPNAIDENKVVDYFADMKKFSVQLKSDKSPGNSLEFMNENLPW